MKKLFLAFAFLGLFTFLTPKVVDAVEPECETVLLVCNCGGGSHYVVVCGTTQEKIEDYLIWMELLCTPCPG